MIKKILIYILVVTITSLTLFSLFGVFSNLRLGVNISGKQYRQYKCGNVGGFPIAYYKGSGNDGETDTDNTGLAKIGCNLDYYLNPLWAYYFDQIVYIIIDLIVTIVIIKQVRKKYPS